LSIGDEDEEFGNEDNGLPVGENNEDGEDEFYKSNK